MINRRRFIQSGLLNAIAASVLPAIKTAALDVTAKDPYRGLKMGVASYTLEIVSSLLDDLRSSHVLYDQSSPNVSRPALFFVQG
jgi:hypothetical protein